MNKRFRALAFITAMLLQVNVCFGAGFTYKKADFEGKNFPDVIGTKYEDAALYLKAFDYISGYPDGTFKPEREITRAEMVAILFAFSFPAKNKLKAQEEPLNTFTDVPMDHWAKQQIEIAAQLGLVSGYGNGIFKPDAHITHAEVITMLLNLHNLKADVLKNEVTSKEKWPNNYVFYYIMTTEKPTYLFDDVSVYSSTNAKRGDVAVYISDIRNIQWE